MIVIREQESVTAAATKAAPPLTAAGMTLMGYGLADWVLLATLVYTVLQIFLLLRGAFKRRQRNGSDA